MPRSIAKHPTELELLILKILWTDAPLLARQVQERLADISRPLAKTTVITTLNNMVSKRYLSRKKQGNTYLFKPLVSQEQVSGQVLEDVVDRVFDGSASDVLLKLFDVTQIDPDELRDLRRLIDQKLNED